MEEFLTTAGLRFFEKMNGEIQAERILRIAALECKIAI
jgi:hypothetical protein